MESLYTENILDAPMDETVCWCSNISKKAIIEAIQNGAVSIVDIRKMTGACTVGNCKELSPRGRCCSKEIMALVAENTVCKGEKQ